MFASGSDNKSGSDYIFLKKFSNYNFRLHAEARVYFNALMMKGEIVVEVVIPTNVIVEIYLLSICMSIS